MQLNAVVIATMLACMPSMALSQENPAPEAVGPGHSLPVSQHAVAVFNTMNAKFGYLFEAFGLTVPETAAPFTLEMVERAIPTPDQARDVGDLKVYLTSESRDPRRPPIENQRDYTVLSSAEGCGPNSENDRTILFRQMVLDGVRGHQCVTIQQDDLGLWRLQSQTVAAGRATELWLNYVTEMMIDDQPGRALELGEGRQEAILVVADSVARRGLIVALAGEFVGTDDPEQLAAQAARFQHRVDQIVLGDGVQIEAQSERPKSD